jgi:hypothetical protein
MGELLCMEDTHAYKMPVQGNTHDICDVDKLFA